jgi:hypothetical protein
MRLGLYLPVLLVCAAGGYGAGALAYARWGDRPEAPADPAAAADARKQVEAIEDAMQDPMGMRLVLQRKQTFRERYPRSWLHAHWKAGP